MMLVMAMTAISSTRVKPLRNQAVRGGRAGMAQQPVDTSVMTGRCWLAGDW